MQKKTYVYVVSYLEPFVLPLVEDHLETKIFADKLKADEYAKTVAGWVDEVELH
jgi:hypothetical protein